MDFLIPVADPSPPFWTFSIFYLGLSPKKVGVNSGHYNLCPEPYYRKYHESIFIESKRDRLKLKLLFLIQHNFNPAPEHSEKNRCSRYYNFNECHLFSSEYSGAGLKNYWIRNNDFNFSLPHNYINKLTDNTSHQTGQANGFASPELGQYSIFL